MKTLSPLRVVTVVGTRPEIIRLSRVIYALDKSPAIDHILVHTGQNYDYTLNEIFFEDLEIRKPNYFLEAAGESSSETIGNIIIKFDPLLNKLKPDALLVLGDTNSSLSSISAKKRKVPIFHMEAGLRAFDKRMPEQRNRILIDHMSDILLPYHKHHRENLIREGIHPSKIIISGNPTFEAMDAFKNEIEESNILNLLDLQPKEYIPVTLHRSENVDNPNILQKILFALGDINKKLGKKIIYPMHPRTRSKITGIEIPKGVSIIKPLGFYDFNLVTTFIFKKK